MSTLMAEHWLGDDDCQPEYVASCHLSEEERRALKTLAEESLHGFTESTLVAHGVSAGTRASLVRRGLASAESRILLSGDRTIELAWIRITDEGRRAIEGSVRSSWAVTRATFRSTPATCVSWPNCKEQARPLSIFGSNGVIREPAK